MNEATRTTLSLPYRKGVLVEWEDAREAAPADLAWMHSPTVIVASDPASPLTFEGGFDEKTIAPIRDKEGEIVRITKAGVYRLPVAVLLLRPVCLSPVRVQTYIQR